MGSNSKLVEEREQHASTGDTEAVENYVFGGTTTKSSAVIPTPAVPRVGKGGGGDPRRRRKRRVRRDGPGAERRLIVTRRRRGR
ncbi:hypothetical protein BMJ34_19015 [Sinorhizobium medicae]|uniref:Uncharacterized protein n=1 Tax=Sinorhizobium medicae TaxID=110321 RepID=A0ABX4TCV0_9HYPH|nr:hypothetical protein BMJ33_32120 [Sinorhizobium medicae]PLT97132.1 hypothetical protein BMJ34_19015 [Sinorhizobium medicae]PLU11130.1 hypothetical protein BMJ29_34930 [Sinorhizobium medicae]PLU20822.1 hypothetical protein BMJ30_07395 [Sinorhizobium medicae]PLU78411.1 hypothetical protein BMJ19_19065 [Sinorhizobium medicae]